MQIFYDWRQDCGNLSLKLLSRSRAQWLASIIIIIIVHLRMQPEGYGAGVASIGSVHNVCSGAVLGIQTAMFILTLSIDHPAHETFNQ